MQGDEPIVRHLVPFDVTFTRGTVVAVQFGAECQNGYVQPVPRLLNLSPDLDLCTEHRTDAVKCFAELATEKVLEKYVSIEHYQVSFMCHYLPLCILLLLFNLYGNYIPELTHFCLVVMVVVRYPAIKNMLQLLCAEASLSAYIVII